MKSLYAYRLPLKNKSVREGLILQIGENFGEIAPLPNFSRETLKEATVEAVAFVKQGKKPTLPSVRFGVECASRSLSSVQLPINALGVKNYPTIKLKVGDLSVSDALALIRSARKHSKIRLDFNRKWTLPQLYEFTSHFDPSDFEYLEEPTHNFSDLVTFSHTTHFPIALDESISDAPHFDLPSLKALVVKPTILGFIPSLNVELIFSSAYESGIGTLHIAALAQLHNPNQAHGLDPYTHFLEDLITPTPTIAQGLLHWSPPFTLNESKLCLLATSS